MNLKKKGNICAPTQDHMYSLLHSWPITCSIFPAPWGPPAPSTAQEAEVTFELQRGVWGERRAVPCARSHLPSCPGLRWCEGGGQRALPSPAEPGARLHSMAGRIIRGSGPFSPHILNPWAGREARKPDTSPIQGAG